MTHIKPVRSEGRLNSASRYLQTKTQSAKGNNPLRIHPGSSHLRSGVLTASSVLNSSPLSMYSPLGTSQPESLRREAPQASLERSKRPFDALPFVEVGFGAAILGFISIVAAALGRRPVTRIA